MKVRPELLGRECEKRGCHVELVARKGEHMWNCELSDKFPGSSGGLLL